MTEPALTPAESMVLTVARSQSGRGDAVPPNTAAVLVMTVDRLAAYNVWLRETMADEDGIALAIVANDGNTTEMSLAEIVERVVTYLAAAAARGSET